MRVLLLGSGGREHALATALVADTAVDDLLCVPGNPGIESLCLQSGVPVRLADGAIDDAEAVVALAVKARSDLVVIGPEKPLVAGVADALRARNIACFGPSQAAAMLEGSKAFAKEIMEAAGVPTAAALVCQTPQEVDAALDRFGTPYVVKDDGLAAGKGVVVTEDRQAARDHALACGRVVIEEYLSGPEMSLFVVADGQDAVPLMPAQDFKRARDGDAGPNTGGMGAYAPLPWAPPGLVDEVMASVVRPTLAEMHRRGTPFAGVLYVGLALTPRGPRVIEFNCRFGDPETQAVLALLQSPLARLLHAAATGSLANHPPLRWHEGAAVTVVLAGAGYPGTLTRVGEVIHGAEGVPGVLHAGTARGAGGDLVAVGGRVLCATARGTTLAEARKMAYGILEGVTLEGGHSRSDIAEAAIRGDIVI